MLSNGDPVPYLASAWLAQEGEGWWLIPGWAEAHQQEQHPLLLLPACAPPHC